MIISEKIFKILEKTYIPKRILRTDRDFTEYDQ